MENICKLGLRVRKTPVIRPSLKIEILKMDLACLMHGILSTLFLAAFWWNLLNLLPLTMGLVFVAAHRRSTTIGIVTHTLHKMDSFLVTIPLFLFGVC